MYEIDWNVKKLIPIGSAIPGFGIGTPTALSVSARKSAYLNTAMIPILRISPTISADFDLCLPPSMNTPTT